MWSPPQEAPQFAPFHEIRTPTQCVHMTAVWHAQDALGMGVGLDDLTMPAGPPADSAALAMSGPLMDSRISPGAAHHVEMLNILIVTPL